MAPSASAAGGGGGDGGATTFLTEAGFAGGARGQAEPLRNERILEILQSENLDAAQLSMIEESKLLDTTAQTTINMQT